MNTAERIQNLTAQTKESAKMWHDGQLCPTCGGKGRVSPMHGGPPNYIGHANAEAREISKIIDAMPDGEDKQKLRRALLGAV